MSTYTKNYSLKKPELTDTSDITQYNESWDKVDDVLNDFEETRNIKTYTSLEQLGLDKATATMLDIIKAIPTNSMLMFEMAQETYNRSAYPKNYGSVRIYHTHHLRVSCEFDSITTSANTAVERFIGNGISNGDSSVWSGWQEDFNESNPPTASDVGAMTQSDYLVYSNYTTVLEAACALPTSGTFFALDNSNLSKAEDTPFASAETTYFVLVDSSRRRTVIAFRYGNGVEFVKIRSIFDERWISTNWKEVFMADGSVSMSGNLTLTNTTWRKTNPDAHTLVETSGNGYVGLYNLITSSVWGGLRIRPITAEQGDFTDTLQLNIKNSVLNKAYNLFGEHNVTKGTTDIGAGSTMTSLIHLVYED